MSLRHPNLAAGAAGHLILAAGAASMPPGSVSSLLISSGKMETET